MRIKQNLWLISLKLEFYIKNTISIKFLSTVVEPN